jgi:peptidyl-prolyl cis-trans isomerase D
MSNEKNIQSQSDAEKKKERISVLERIRRRTGLLVGIVGLALVIFILESLLGSGASIFGGDEMSSVGYINGKKIDRNEFVMRLENALNSYRSRSQSNDVDESTRASVIDNVWQQYVSELVIVPQFDKIGITVGDDEVYESVVSNPVPTVMQQISDPKTGRVNEQIARPDGSLDLVKWKQVIQNLPAEQESGIRQMEEMVKNSRYYEKFRTLINKGLYVTTAEAKEALKAKTSSLNMSYVVKRFDSVSDSTVKVSDSDIQKYYNDHSYEFTNPETTRKV